MLPKTVSQQCAISSSPLSFFFCSSFSILRLTSPCGDGLAPSVRHLLFFRRARCLHFCDHLIVLQILLVHNDPCAEGHDGEKDPGNHYKRLHAPQLGRQVVNDCRSTCLLWWALIYWLGDIEKGWLAHARAMIVALDEWDLRTHGRGQHFLKCLHVLGRNRLVDVCAILDGSTEVERAHGILDPTDLILLSDLSRGCICTVRYLEALAPVETL